VLAGSIVGIAFGYLMAKAYFRTDVYLLKKEQNKK
jgi:hypothetical protein